MRPVKNIEKLIRKINVTPDAKMNQRTLDEILKAQEKAENLTSASFQPSIWRMIMKSKTTKFAVAAVIVMAVIAGINQFGGKTNNANVAWADVLEQIYNAKSVTYNETFETEDGIWTNANMINGSGVKRTVLRDSNDVLLFDSKTGTHLQIIPSLKKVLIIHQIGKSRGKKLFNYLDWMSRLHKESAKFTGQQIIAGKTTDVFVVENPFDKTTIWVDSGTDLPVRVEMEDIPNPDRDIITPKMFLSFKDFGGENGISVSSTIGSSRGSPEGIQKRMKITMSDMAWNVDLDPSVFSLKPPEGYAVEEKQSDASEPDERDLIKALAFWREMSDDMFPDTINELGDENDVRPMLVKKFHKGGEPKEEFDQACQMMNVLLRGLFFAQKQKVDGNWGYAGSKVKFGDSDEPVCWWKPKDSDKYRVIYGDLSIGDSNDVPQAP